MPSIGIVRRSGGRIRGAVVRGVHSLRSSDRQQTTPAPSKAATHRARGWAVAQTSRSVPTVTNV